VLFLGARIAKTAPDLLGADDPKKEYLLDAKQKKEEKG
tara:strand:- start:367 stop:480 length:114 start_codon:yes stop_codon:yes gene_type:complete